MPKDTYIEELSLRLKSLLEDFVMQGTDVHGIIKFVTTEHQAYSKMRDEQTKELLANLGKLIRREKDEELETYKKELREVVEGMKKELEESEYAGDYENRGFNEAIESLLNHPILKINE